MKTVPWVYKQYVDDKNKQFQCPNVDYENNCTENETVSSFMQNKTRLCAKKFRFSGDFHQNFIYMLDMFTYKSIIRASRNSFLVLC